MPDIFDIADFLEPLKPENLLHEEDYTDGQIGKVIAMYEEKFPDIEESDIVLVGCNEERGFRLKQGKGNGPDAIRRHFYQLFFWHNDIRLADIGNIKEGVSKTEAEEIANRLKEAGADVEIA